MCKAEGCEKFKTNSWGYCARHREQKKRGAPFTFGPKQQTGHQQEWMLSHVSHDEDECLPWPFKTYADGRGQFSWRQKTCRAHRVMCELRNGPPPTPKHEAAHSCGNGHLGCVNPKHLRWATRQENVDDMLLHGTRVRGEKTHWAVLNEQNVRDIREMATVLPTTLIAQEYGITRQHCNTIISRRTWRHVA